MASPISAKDGRDPERISVSIEIQAYDSTRGVGSWNDEGAQIRIESWTTPEPTMVLSGNPAGLTSLARHLLTLVQDQVPDGRHFDFDTYSGWLADDSIALRLEVEEP